MKRTIFLITSIIVSCHFIDSFIVDAHAGSLEITNYSAALGGDNCYAYTKHTNGATEGYGYGDSTYLNSPAQLQIYIHNVLLNYDFYKDARGLNSITPYDVKLEANGFISYADNSLKFKVFNSDGALNHRFVIAYDTSKDINDVNNIHIIPKNGDIIEVPLPALVNQPAGVYATWRVEMPRLIEGDVNEDGKCDFLDYAILANEWMQTTTPTGTGDYMSSDLNLDRITDYSDLEAIAENWLMSE